jgi:hypothetical protein
MSSLNCLNHGDDSDDETGRGDGDGGNSPFSVGGLVLLSIAIMLAAPGMPRIVV